MFPDEAFAKQERHGCRKVDNRGQGNIDISCDAAYKVNKISEELGLKIPAVHQSVQGGHNQKCSRFSKFERHVHPVKQQEAFDRAAVWWFQIYLLRCGLG